tara:strand:+ start:143 stop:709 length:567 start_codon:yes stop_codon:yes gene_type:complete
MSNEIQRNIRYQTKHNLDTTTQIFQDTYEDLTLKYANIFMEMGSVRHGVMEQRRETAGVINEQLKLKYDLNKKQEKFPLGYKGSQVVLDENGKLSTNAKDNYILLSKPELGVVSFTKREYIQQRPVFTSINTQLYPSKPPSGGILMTDGEKIQWTNQNALVFDLPDNASEAFKGQLYRDGEYVKIKLT